MTLNDLQGIENYFKVSCNVYNLLEDATAQVVRLSKLDHPTLFLNIYGNHFSFIKDFPKYAKKYTCITCSRIFNTHRSHKRHAKECQFEVKEYFKGGKYRQKKTIFEELDDVDIKVPDEIRHCPWFSTFDFESLHVTDDKIINGRKIISRHEPATLPTCSNLGDQKPEHKVSEGNTQELVDKLVTQHLEEQKTFSSLMRERYKPYILTSKQKD